MSAFYSNIDSKVWELEAMVQEGLLPRSPLPWKRREADYPDPGHASRREIVSGDPTPGVWFERCLASQGRAGWVDAMQHAGRMDVSTVRDWQRPYENGIAVGSKAYLRAFAETYRHRRTPSGSQLDTRSLAAKASPRLPE